MDRLIFKTIFGWVFAPAGKDLPAATQHKQYYSKPLLAMEAAFQSMAGAKELSGIYLTPRSFRELEEGDLRALEQAHPNPIFVTRDEKTCLWFP